MEASEREIARTEATVSAGRGWRWPVGIGYEGWRQRRSQTPEGTRRSDYRSRPRSQRRMAVDPMTTLRHLFESFDEEAAETFLNGRVLQATEKNGIVVLVLEIDDCEDDDED
jgi:hypothetical protein